MKNLIFLFLTTLLFIACNHSKESSLRIVDVHVNDTSEVNLSEIASDIKVVNLETLDTCLISTIRGISVADEKIYVNDGGRRLLEFDKEGHFIRQIGRRGNGPGEYTSVFDFALDTINNKLFINTLRSISCYDMDGNFHGSIQVPGRGEDFSIISGDVGIIATQNGLKTEGQGLLDITHLYSIDDDLNVYDSLEIYKLIQIRQMGSLLPYMQVVSDIETGQYIYFPVLFEEPAFRDTLYLLKNRQFIPNIKLNIDASYSVSEGRRNLTIYRFYRTGRYVFANFGVDGKERFFCYDLDDEMPYCFSMGFTDDVLKSGATQLMPLDLMHNKLYFVKYGYELEGIVDGMEENSNPVLVIVTLKD